MLAYAWPAGWLLLLPVVVLEAFVARRVLGGSWRSSLRISGLSNFVSTLAGIPIAWVAILLLGTLVRLLTSGLPQSVRSWILMPFHAAWLPPFRDSPLWLVPAAGAFLCLPFFAASVWIERRVAQRFAGLQVADVRRWAWQANLASYSLIAAALAGWALFLGFGT
jgi:hypothetical protein